MVVTSAGIGVAFCATWMAIIPIRDDEKQQTEYPNTLAAKILTEDVGDPGHAAVLLRGMLGTD